MVVEQELKQTPLHGAHQELGAKLVDFAGWSMPMQYQGISAEHMAVRTSSGLFDVSHMGEIRIKGQGAEDFLRYATLNDPKKLRVGRGQYSMLPNDKGGLIDDLYIYREAEDDFLIIANASNYLAVASHLDKLAQDYDCDVVDESDDWALLALQGSEALGQLNRLLADGEDSLDDLKKNRFRDCVLGGVRARAAKTGYTGESIGFEIFVRPDDALTLWDAIIGAGATPCGLGARDTLRLEAGFPLFGHEFSATTNPLCSSYAWVVKDKDFYGREAMWQPSCDKALVGLNMKDKGIPREGYKLFKDDICIGEVTSGTMSPLLKKGIALAWVDKEASSIGLEIMVEVRAKLLAAEICETPFI